MYIQVDREIFYDLAKNTTSTRMFIRKENQTNQVILYEIVD